MSCMIRTQSVWMVLVIAGLAWTGMMQGCTPSGGGGGAAPCGAHGDGCETDADCCAGLVCEEWTCEPAGVVPDDDNNGPVEHPGGIIADHSAADDFDSIPDEFITTAKSDYRIFYGHTSHGSQIITGMNMVDTGPGTLSIEENEDMDLGSVWDLPDQAWVDETRSVLDRSGSDINMVMWSWCGGVSDNTAAGIDAYLDAMDQLESEYLHVVFVYMTGHLDGTGSGGNLHARNNQIRAYCEANDKVLFDFADIESYDPDGTCYLDPDGTDWCEWCGDWCASHSCPTGDCVDDEDCQHSMCFNCYRKGQAFWWMMARIAGWSGSPGDTIPPDGNDNDNANSPATSSERLQSTDLTYMGAFRLPEDFNWGALGLSFYPDGDGGVGSLLVTGFELVSGSGDSAYYGEVAIPAPADEANWEDLPEATFLTELTAFDEGLVSTVHPEYVYASDLEYVPLRGSQTSDKLYGAANLWYAEGAVGIDTFPTIWFANLDGTDAQGMFHVGPTGEDPYHGRKMGAYLFSVPEWYADQYLGGRTLITGRARGTPLEGLEPVTTDGGSQGPTLFAFHALESDIASGDLDALPVLYYRVAFPGCAGPNVGDPDECDYPGYTMCDDWTGGAFVEDSDRRAIMLLGYKGHSGNNCYGNVECDNPCDDSQGYHCNPYERQVIFYDVDELGQSARGLQDPWVVRPYETWSPDEFYLDDNPCMNMGGMTFDTDGRRLFMVERGLGGVDTNAIVVHVWSL